MTTLQDEFLKDFNDFNYGLDTRLIAEINTSIKEHFDSLVDWYNSKEKFLSEEEKAELYQVIKQKIYLKLSENIKPFILLRK